MSSSSDTERNSLGKHEVTKEKPKLFPSEMAGTSHLPLGCSRWCDPSIMSCENSAASANAGQGPASHGQKKWVEYVNCAALGVIHMHCMHCIAFT